VRRTLHFGGNGDEDRVSVKLMDWKDIRALQITAV
jgi:hypothetical protein